MSVIELLDLIPGSVREKAGLPVVESDDGTARVSSSGWFEPLAQRLAEEQGRVTAVTRKVEGPPVLEAKPQSVERVIYTIRKDK